MLSHWGGGRRAALGGRLGDPPWVKKFFFGRISITRRNSPMVIRAKIILSSRSFNWNTPHFRVPPWPTWHVTSWYKGKILFGENKCMTDSGNQRLSESNKIDIIATSFVFIWWLIWFFVFDQLGLYRIEMNERKAHKPMEKLDTY